VLGLPYVYPGIDHLELCRNGANMVVTEADTAKYVALLTEFTVGTRVAKLAERFREGFYSVVERGLWEKFTPAEMAKIISGEAVRWTREDLEQNIKFAKGYKDTAPQRRMLIDTIMAFNDAQKAQFLKFITGCERLPIGGLGALHPRITVANRVTEEGESPDESLPTVATCSNYFKLPPYSCQPVMMERILLAISEGQAEFGLS
jgi:hypothetical protein